MARKPVDCFTASRLRYERPQTVVCACELPQMVAASVRGMSSGWTDDDETVIEFNFTSTNNSTSSSSSAGTSKSVSVGNLSLKSVWEDSYDWSN